jgi:hypothetical protein
MGCVTNDSSVAVGIEKVNRGGWPTGVDITQPDTGTRRTTPNRFDNDQDWGRTEKIAISRQTETTAKYLNGDK